MRRKSPRTALNCRHFLHSSRLFPFRNHPIWTLFGDIGHSRILSRNSQAVSLNCGLKYTLKMKTWSSRKVFGNRVCPGAALHRKGAYLRIHSQSLKIDGRTHSSNLSIHFFIQRILSWANPGSFCWKLLSYSHNWRRTACQTLLSCTRFSWQYVSYHLRNLYRKTCVWPECWAADELDFECCLYQARQSSVAKTGVNKQIFA